MAGRILAHDWSSTPLGPIEGWPPSLRMAVEMMLAMPGPAAVLWGPDHVQLYNDAYIAIARHRHPALLGRPVAAGWPEAHAALTAPLLERARAGLATRLTDVAIALRGPDGELRRRIFDTDWVPIRDEGGAVAGVLQILAEATGRHEVEAALRDSEARHRFLTESWAQAVWETDAEGVVVADSPSWRAYTGQTLEQWMGDGWLDAIHPEDRAYAGRQWREAVAARGPVDAEFRLRAPGGDWRWTNVRAAAVRDAAGQVEKWVGMNIDVHARRDAEAALRESEERNALLVRFADEVRGLTDPALVAQASCRILTERLGTDRTLWAVIDPEGREYVAEWAFLADGTRAEPSRWPFDPRDPFAAEHLAGRPVVYEDSGNHPLIPAPVAAAMAERGLRAGIAVPVLVAGALRAVLNTSQSAAARRWGPEEIAFVEVLAGRAWAEIERARTSATLRESEARLRNVLDSMDEGFALLGPDFTIRDVNGEAVRLIRLPREALVGRSHWDAFAGSADAQIGAFLRRVMHGRAPDALEHRYVWPDGRVTWLDARAFPVPEGGLAIFWRDVTDRRLTEEALRESEERYRTLFEAMDQAYAVVEVLRDEAGAWQDFRFLEVNPAFMAHTSMPYPVGRTATELLGTPNPRWTQLYGQVLDTGEAVRVQEPEPTLGRVFDLNIFALDRTHDRVAVLFTDISERMRTEAALRESEERQAFLLKLGDTLRATPTEAIIGRAVDMLAEELQLDLCYVVNVVPDEDRADVVHQLRRRADMPGVPAVIRLSDYPQAFLEWQERTLVSDDMAKDPALTEIERRNVAAMRFGALIAAPVRRGAGNPIWSIVAVMAGSRRWTASQVALVEETTERTWAAVERARAEGALRESEERFRLIVENARDYAILTLGTDGRIADWFPGAEQVFGWSRDEARGQPVDITFTAEDRAAGAPAEEQEIARRDGAAPDIRWHVRKDGSRVFIDGIASAIHDPDGRLRGYLKIGQDVTERRAAEQALRESEERFRQLGEASSDIIWIRDAETMAYEYVSPAFETIYGRPRAEVGDGFSRWVGTIHPEDRDRVLANLDRVRDGERVAHEFRILRPDGEVRWVADVDFPLRDAEGRVARIGGIGHDATVGKQAADALRASEERFRGFAENSADVLWIADGRRRRLEYLSPAFERVFGSPRAPILDGSRRMRDLIHPEDHAAFDSGWPQAVANGGAVIHYRVIRPSGAVIHLRDTLFPIRDAGGAIIRIAGIVQDVSDMVTAREALEGEKERFRTLAEGIPPLVWRSADEGMWSWASPQWREYTGQGDEESRGLGWLKAVHPDDRKRTMAAWHEARPHGRLDVEHRVRRASDGAWRWHQTRSIPLRGGPTARQPAGRILEWLGTTTEIEDLKRLQAEQSVLVAELQHRTRNLLAVVRNVARRSIPPQPGRDEYDARLAALGRVQGFLARTGRYVVALHDLVEAELQAAGDGTSDRVTVRGPDVDLPGEGAQPVALALHELATNAVKYGAIARPEGRLSVTWRIAGEDGRLLIAWEEHGVPMPGGPPARQGYGSELITRALPYQMGAETALEFTPDGVRCSIALPAGSFRMAEP